MKKFYLFVFVAAIAIFSSCGKNDSANPDNPDDPNDPTSEIVWSTDLSHTIQTTTNHYPAVDDNGNIYLITKEYGVGSVVQAFDKNGSELWEKHQDKYPRNYSVSYYDGNVYFLTTEELICLDAQNGNEKWSVSESVEADLGIGNQDNFTFVGNNLVIPLINIQGTFLVKLDPSSGHSNGSIQVCKQNRVVPRIAAKGNTIYIAEDSLYVISESGIAWRANIENTEHTTKDVYDLIITQNNDIVVSTKSEMSNQRNVYLYKSEELLWSINFGTDVLTPKISELSNGNLALAMGNLLTVDAASGNEIWKLNSEILKSYETANVAANGKIFGGNAYGIWGIDEDGNTISVFDPNNDPISNSILQKGENIIVLSMGTDNSIIHCVKEENTGGYAPDLWSGYGANAANTFNTN